MKQRILKIVRIGFLTSACLLMASCEPPQIYGSVGYSSYGGGYGHGGMGGNVRIGGRIY